MRNIYKLILAFIIIAFIVMFIIYEFSIKLHSSALMFLLYLVLLGSGGTIVYFIYQKAKQSRKVKSKTWEVYDRAKEIWESRTNEKITWETGRIIPKIIGNEMRWGIVVQRSNPSKFKNYIIFIVDEKCDIFLVNDNPKDEELLDPFKYHNTFTEIHAYQPLPELLPKMPKKKGKIKMPEYERSGGLFREDEFIHESDFSKSEEE